MYYAQYVVSLPSNLIRVDDAIGQSLRLKIPDLQSPKVLPCVPLALDPANREGLSPSGSIVVVGKCVEQPRVRFKLLQ